MTGREKDWGLTVNQVLGWTHTPPRGGVTSALSKAQAVWRRCKEPVGGIVMQNLDGKPSVEIKAWNPQEDMRLSPLN